MIGLDVGSTSAKIVYYKEGKMKDYKITKSHLWKNLLKKISPKEKIISTGYFRKSVPHKKAITEITSAIYGIKHYFDDIEVIVDIGGQDVKVIDIRDNSFYLNDKCSAGTGAFLELIAKNFNLEIENLGKIALEAKKKAKINNTCAVFAISEMVSKLVQGYKIEEVLAGIHYSFSKKISSIIPKSKKIALIGGTTKNIAIKKYLETIMGQKFYIPQEPQIINALGAIKYFKDQ